MCDARSYKRAVCAATYATRSPGRDETPTLITSPKDAPPEEPPPKKDEVDTPNDQDKDKASSGAEEEEPWGGAMAKGKTDLKGAS